MKTRTACSLFTLIIATMGLSGCVIKSYNDFDVYDSSTVNPDRFAEQTRPAWERRHVTTGKVVMYESELEEPVATQTEYPETDPVTTQTIVRQDSRYNKLDDMGHWLPAIPVSDVPTKFLRREVTYDGVERPGTIVVDTAARHLYLVLEGGRAMRYGVGIGRMGYAWKGRGTIRYKKSWPRWTPSEAYVADRPDMKIFSASYGGMVGGTNNPLGARALYIFQDGKDTLYRVHGTPDWKSVGKQVSSGCVRMFNQDVIDLFNRVEDGAEIIVR